MTFKSPEEFHNRLGFIFHALLLFPLAVFAYLFMEIKGKTLDAFVQGETLIWCINVLFSVLGIGLFLYALRQFKKLFPTLKGLDMQEKLSLYYFAAKRFYIVGTMASAILVAGLYLTASPIFIIAYVFLLFFLSLSRPTPQQYVKDIPFNEQEKNIIIHKGSFDELNK